MCQVKMVKVFRRADGLDSTDQGAWHGGQRPSVEGPLWSSEYHKTNLDVGCLEAELEHQNRLYQQRKVIRIWKRSTRYHKPRSTDPFFRSLFSLEENDEKRHVRGHHVGTLVWDSILDFAQESLCRDRPFSSSSAKWHVIDCGVSAPKLRGSYSGDSSILSNGEGWIHVKGKGRSRRENETVKVDFIGICEENEE
jgi:hypothetical protein